MEHLIYNFIKESERNRKLKKIVLKVVSERDAAIAGLGA